MSKSNHVLRRLRWAVGKVLSAKASVRSGWNRIEPLEQRLLWTATPGAPDLLTASDTGVSGSDNITFMDNSSSGRALQFNVAGTVVGAEVRIFADGTEIGSSTASGTITRVVTAGALDLVDGTHTIVARQTLGGVDSADSSPLSITIDTTALMRPGLVDTTFGSSGLVSTGGGVNRHARATAVQTDGKILVAGYDTGVSTYQDFVILRYNTNGSLDSTFGTGGIAHVDFLRNGTSSDDYGQAIAIQSDGKIVVAGSSYMNCGLARLNTNGTLDTTFGTGGCVRGPYSPAGDAVATAVAIGSDGKIVMAGSMAQGYVVARFNTNGTYDTTLNGTGWLRGQLPDRVSDEVHGVAVQTDGKIVIAGAHFGLLGSDKAFLVRFNTNGTTDATFGSSGVASIDFSSGFDGGSVLLQTDGKIILTGTQYPGGLMAARFNTTGTLDTTFGFSGILALPSAAAGMSAALGSDGKIVVAGGGKVTRLTSTGFQDDTFGNYGSVLFTGNATGVAVKSDGRIVVVGDATGSTAGTNINVMQFLKTPAAGVDLQAASDTGASMTDNITKNTSLTFNVTPGPGVSYYRVYRGTTRVSSTFATGSTITLTGQPAGTYDYSVSSVDAAGNESAKSGALRVTIDTTAPTATITPVSPDPRMTSVSSMTVKFSEKAYGFDLSDLVLTRNGVAVALTGATLTSSDRITWTLGNLAGLSGTDGTHVLTLNSSGTGITDTAGNAMTTGAGDTWVKRAVFSTVAYYGDAANYTPLTASRWSVASDGGDLRYFINTSSFTEQSGYRLGEYSLIKNRTFGDFTMTAQVRTAENLTTNTAADYALVFGYVDANNYCYMMMNATQSWTELFSVVNGVRQDASAIIATRAGIPDTAYHTVTLSRVGTKVTVKLDGVQILTASSSAFGAVGAVGIGSLNDAAYFDNVNVV